MAEAVGIDKEKPKEAVTVAVKMLKGAWGGGRGTGRGGNGVGSLIKNVPFVACELYHGRGSEST